ncbi:MAG: cytochrome C, partial [Alphaproteobacteria bacterium]|nr:cytochrome C [Alphaproteobacteria bacterium]
MTCIVAIAQNGVVYMGSDHAASDDKTGWILSRKEPKVFKNGQYGIPTDNPFAKSKDADLCKEIYCRGFRNPNRIVWTPKGKMLIT